LGCKPGKGYIACVKLMDLGIIGLRDSCLPTGREGLRNGEGRDTLVSNL
jgi:hypothetical protein